MALRSQRTNHVLHCEYTSTGENLEEEYEIATENGVFQMNGRSDNPIIMVEIGQYDGGRGLQKGLTEDTSVLRDGGGIMETKFSKNS